MPDTRSLQSPSCRALAHLAPQQPVASSTIYSNLTPYINPVDQSLALIAQVIIFFNLISSLAQPMGIFMDVVLTTLLAGFTAASFFLSVSKETGRYDRCKEFIATLGQNDRVKPQPQSSTHQCMSVEEDVDNMVTPFTETAVADIEPEDKKYRTSAEIDRISSSIDTDISDEAAGIRRAQLAAESKDRRKKEKQELARKNAEDRRRLQSVGSS